ncbi:hypothetical protein D3C85_768670 [compost metagenome]
MLIHGAQFWNSRYQRLGISLLRARKNISGGSGLNHVTPVHHQRTVRDFRHDPHIVSDEHHRHLLLRLQFLDQFQYLRLNGHIERRGRFIGDENRWIARQCHRDHHALTHAARKLMRIIAEALVTCRNPDAIHKSQHFGACLGVIQSAMKAQGFYNLFPNAHDRVERSHRLLKNHGNPVAAQGRHFRF